MFDDALELQWETMERAGYSKEQIDLVKQRKKDTENARIYGYMVQQHAWEFDISCDRVDVHLKLARALDAICRRSDAIEILREAARTIVSHCSSSASSNISSPSMILSINLRVLNMTY